MAALVFLDLNGVAVEILEDYLVEHVLEVAQGRSGKAEVAAFLRAHAMV